MRPIRNELHYGVPGEEGGARKNGGESCRLGGQFSRLNRDPKAAVGDLGGVVFRLWSRMDVFPRGLLLARNLDCKANFVTMRLM